MHFFILNQLNTGPAECSSTIADIVHLIRLLFTHPSVLARIRTTGVRHKRAVPITYITIQSMFLVMYIRDNGFCESNQRERVKPIDSDTMK